MAKPHILKVGPTRRLKLPSHAAPLAHDHTVVEIDSGTYRDCAVWSANHLTLKAAAGPVHLRDRTCAGKAIWVIEGNNTVVDGIRFSGAAVPDKNGAGIRAAGQGLTVRDSHFHDNENGILGHSSVNSVITITNSRFERNGHGDGQSHGIYINRIAELHVVDCVFRGQRIGHHIKSRAQHTTITGTVIEDGKTGTASYAIDLPNSGSSLIAGNHIHKGRRSDNRGTAIAIGAEGNWWPTGRHLIKNNLLTTDLKTSFLFIRNWSLTPVTLHNNTVPAHIELLGRP